MPALTCSTATYGDLLMPDVLTAIADIIKYRVFTLPHAGAGHTNVNGPGMSFEMYCKDRLVGLEPGDDVKRESMYRRHLAYQGAKNHPPDAMYRGGNDGDAFEFKKREGHAASDIPLNSSWPKDRLTVDSHGVLDDCRKCESWSERNLFYVCGGVPKGTSRLKWIWLCDARLMSAEAAVYERLREHLRTGIAGIRATRFADTKELGRVTNIDPRNSTSLRMRGMWNIAGPGKMFKDVPGVSMGGGPNLHALIRRERWLSYPAASRSRLERMRGSGGTTIGEVRVPNPNGGAPIPSMLVRFEITPT